MTAPALGSGGYTAAERDLLDSLGGYQKVFNAIADATSVYPRNEGTGVAISVRDFIRSINPDSAYSALSLVSEEKES